jgi:hypothetical protein
MSDDGRPPPRSPLAPPTLAVDPCECDPSLPCHCPPDGEDALTQLLPPGMRDTAGHNPPQPASLLGAQTAAPSLPMGKLESMTLPAPLTPAAATPAAVASLLEVQAWTAQVQAQALAQAQAAQVQAQALAQAQAMAGGVPAVASVFAGAPSSSVSDARWAAEGSAPAVAAPRHSDLFGDATPGAAGVVPTAAAHSAAAASSAAAAAAEAAAAAVAEAAKAAAAEVAAAEAAAAAAPHAESAALAGPMDGLVRYDRPVGATPVCPPLGAPIGGPAQSDSAAKRHVGGVERVDAFGRRRRYFTMGEIRVHNTPTDCWLVSHGKVYDVTPFLASHPAGEFAILRHGGTDSTADFDFHSPKAQRMWAPYLLGYVDAPAYERGDCVIS